MSIMLEVDTPFEGCIEMLHGAVMSLRCITEMKAPDSPAETSLACFTT